MKPITISPGTYREIQPYGEKVHNSRIANIDRGDRLPPTQKPKRGWKKLNNSTDWARDLILSFFYFIICKSKSDKKNRHKQNNLRRFWRRVRDSNPRPVHHRHEISSFAPSTTRTTLRISAWNNYSTLKNFYQYK